MPARTSCERPAPRAGLQSVVPHFRRKVSSTCAPPSAGLAAFTLMSALLLAAPCGAAEPLKVGSKRFTESYIVAEIVTLTAARAGPARHLPGLGSTAILYAALRQGSIDLYPEYLGTIAAELLKLPAAAAGDVDGLNRLLAPQGLGIAVPLGFANGYALAMRGEAAMVAPPRTLSALAAAPALRIGLSPEFIGRADGWTALRDRYALPQTPVALDHGLAYEALRNSQVDVIDVYTTDAQITRLGLAVLDDDRQFFPRYDAVLLYRLDLPSRHPAAWQALHRLAGRIDEGMMRAMNARAEIDREPFARIAAGFVERGSAGPAGGPAGGAASGATGSAAGGAASGAAGGAGGLLPPASPASFLDRLFGDDFARLAGQHVGLVLGSVALATLLGVPLGVLASRRPRLQQWVLSLAGVAQTIPSLALLAVLIPLVGRIGTVPALIALVVYALLPIVRNTCVGLAGVADGLRQAALAIGLTPRQQLRHVELPVAAPVILAGIKTAAVVSVGTATIAAFIGAGGFGERISIGLALDDHQMLLAGALPSAALALLTQWLFDLIERVLIGRRGSSAVSAD